MIPLEAIADPVRLRLIRRLAERGPAGLKDLAAAAEVHPNTARPHLLALEEAGVLVRERDAPAGRGHPASVFRLVEGYTPPSQDFRGLAELLAAALARSDPRPRDLRALGMEWGRFLLGRPGAVDLAQALPLALERIGFQARLARGELRLSACPCPAILPGRPETLCRLAVAVVEGILAGAGSDLIVAEGAHDPARRSCILKLRKGVRRA